MSHPSTAFCFLPRAYSYAAGGPCNPTPSASTPGSRQGFIPPGEIFRDWGAGVGGPCFVHPPSILRVTIWGCSILRSQPIHSLWPVVMPQQYTLRLAFPSSLSLLYPLTPLTFFLHHLSNQLPVPKSLPQALLLGEPKLRAPGKFCLPEWHAQAYIYKSSLQLFCREEYRATRGVKSC